MKSRIDMDGIAKGLGAVRAGKVHARSGYFGALQLLADIESRLRVPPGGGRPTDRRWTKKRLAPLAPRTQARLEDITATLREQRGVNIEPMQIAAILLEKTTERLSEQEATERLGTRRRTRP